MLNGETNLLGTRGKMWNLANIFEKQLEIEEKVDKKIVQRCR